MYIIRTMSRPFAIVNLPNGITLLRIILVPVILGLLILVPRMPGTVWPEIVRYTALFFYLIATFSDLFDGYLARRRRETSNFGKLIDPVADKLLALTLMFFFTTRDILPLWYTLIFLWRELIITALRSVAASEGIVISASTAGKRKTVYVNIGLGFLFVPPELWMIPTRLIAWGCLLVSLGYCLLSAWQYCQGFYEQVLKKQTPR